MQTYLSTTFSGNRIDKNFSIPYNSNMSVYGKKQIDIREDNKSAVIDILLKGEATMLEMSERLKLSHTALAKVIKELTLKNIVQPTEVRGANTGRPPKVYGINGDCAIACAVVISAEKIYVYYLDMRGFQINETSCDNLFADFSSLMNYVTGQVEFLKSHPRLNDKILKCIYIGVPAAGLFGMSYPDTEREVLAACAARFSLQEIVVRRNIDYEMVAETKYGLLKGGDQNAVLVNLDRRLCASFLFNGNLFCGDRQKQGLGSAEEFGGVYALFPHSFESAAAQYRAGEESARETLERALREPLTGLGKLLAFLDVGEVVFSGGVKALGDPFLRFAGTLLGENCSVRYSALGKEVPAALSGAVWLSTYSTLQKVMAR